MLPASVANSPSQSSSQDYVRPVIVHVGGSSSLATEEDEPLWCPSSTSLHSDAFHSALSVEDRATAQTSPACHSAREPSSPLPSGGIHSPPPRFVAPPVPTAPTLTAASERDPAARSTAAAPASSAATPPPLLGARRSSSETKVRSTPSGSEASDLSTDLRGGLYSSSPPARMDGDGAGHSDMAGAFAQHYTDNVVDAQGGDGAEGSSGVDESTNVRVREGGGGGWWASVKQGLSNWKGWIDGYLDNIMDLMIAPRRLNRSDTPLSALSMGPSSSMASSGLDEIFSDGSPRGLRWNPSNEPYDFGSRNPGVAGTVTSQRIVVDFANEPFPHHAPMIRPADNVAEIIYDGPADVDEEQPIIEVDLVSALKSYRRSPNECYGHLVAAALSTRSADNPVTAMELREANHNPFLVRLIIESGWLDENDPAMQTQVQETLDRLLESRPTLHEYLHTFFHLPFITLSSEQYVQLKHSGFEYIVLLHNHQHVLPDKGPHSVLVNYSTRAYILNLVLMILNIAANIFCTVAIFLALAEWMTVRDGGYQSYGFYTLIVYGCGYALNLISIIFIMRTKQDETFYTIKDGLTIPPPYVNVVPAIPIFDVMCLVTYIRAAYRRNIVVTHNVLACSRISAVCYAALFGMPQLIAQSYFNNNDEHIPPNIHKHWEYKILLAGVFIQWGVALLRFMWMMLVYESTSRMGFARFSIGTSGGSQDRNCGVIHILHYLTVYILYSNIYLITASSIMYEVKSACRFLPILTMSLAGLTIVLILIIYLLLVTGIISVINISFINIPVLLIQVALFVITLIHYNGSCKRFDQVVLKGSFLFGYVSWCAYAVVFVVWLGLIIILLAHSTCGLKMFTHLIPSQVSNKPGAEKGPWESDNAFSVSDHDSSPGSPSAAAEEGEGEGEGEGVATD